MLLNNGHHPDTNESIIPSDVVEHVAYGRSVIQGKPKFPELVRKCFFLSDKRDLIIQRTGFFYRVPRYTEQASFDTHIKVTTLSSMVGVTRDTKPKSLVFRMTTLVSSLSQMITMLEDSSWSLSSFV